MSTFWGVTVNANDHKTAEIPDGFALVVRTMSLVKGKRCVVKATIDDTEYVFATLIEGVFPQHSFNLAFYPESVVDLKVESSDKDAAVSFVGALESLSDPMDDYDDMDDEDMNTDDEDEDEDEKEEEEEEEEEKKPVKAEKRKEEKKPAAAAAPAAGSFKCTECNRVFKTNEAKEQHMKSKHAK